MKRVLVEASQQEETTAFGIVLPDSAKEKPQEGTIIAVGSGQLKDGVRVPLEVKEGDRVLFSKYAGTEIKVRRQRIPDYERKRYSRQSSVNSATLHTYIAWTVSSLSTIFSNYEFLTY